MARWTAFPHDAARTATTPAALKKKWARLHAGDAEPLPKDDKVLAAWRTSTPASSRRRPRPD